jgi:ribosome-associated translation inhibitor RaiA
MELDIRITDIDPLKALRTSLRRRLRFALGRFAPSIRHVRVRLSETKGSPRPLEAKCQMVVGLAPAGRLLVSERASDVHSAVDHCVDRLARTMTRRIEVGYESTPDGDRKPRNGDDTCSAQRRDRRGKRNSTRMR